MEHAEETTGVRIVRLEKDISEVKRSNGKNTQWRWYLTGAVAVLGVALLAVPWMVERKIEEVLIKHQIIRFAKGGER